MKVWYLDNGQRSGSDRLDPSLTQPMSQSISPSLTNANWQLAGSGDFDGNNTFDLLWHNLDTGAAQVWFMDGQLGRLSEASVDASADADATDLNWAIAGQGDYDQNGIADIVWHNSVTGATKLWLMQGATVERVMDLTLSLPT